MKKIAKKWSYLNVIAECVTNFHNVHVALAQSRKKDILMKIFDTMHIAKYSIHLTTQTGWHTFSIEILHVAIDAVI